VSRALTACIFALDALLRRCWGIYAYSDTNADILRIAVQTAKSPVTLSDGWRVSPGDLVIDLHIWNERVCMLGPIGPSLAWASRVRHCIEHSLTTLAEHLAASHRLESCAAVRAEAFFLTGRGARKLARIARFYGLSEPFRPEAASMGHGLLAYALTWACNPQTLAGRRLRPTRHEFWISGPAFRARYGPAGIK
jgi:hypothetical protein